MTPTLQFKFRYATEGIELAYSKHEIIDGKIVTHLVEEYVTPSRLTNFYALIFLSQNPKNLDYFDIYPDNWQELCIYESPESFSCAINIPGAAPEVHIPMPQKAAAAVKNNENKKAHKPYVRKVENTTYKPVLKKKPNPKKPKTETVLKPPEVVLNFFKSLNYHKFFQTEELWRYKMRIGLLANVYNCWLYTLLFTRCAIRGPAV